MRSTALALLVSPLALLLSVALVSGRAAAQPAPDAPPPPPPAALPAPTPDQTRAALRALFLDAGDLAAPNLTLSEEPKKRREPGGLAGRDGGDMTISLSEHEQISADYDS